MTKIHIGGLATIAGGTLGVILTPILTYLWISHSKSYLYFGRVYFLVYVGCLAGIAGFATLRKQSSSRTGAERTGLGMVSGGLAVSLAGDIPAYWGGSPRADFNLVQAAAFSIELLGLLILLAGSTVLGVACLRDKTLPLALGVSSLLPVWVLAFVHVELPVLILGFAWTLLGYMLLVESGETVRLPSRTR